MEIGIKRIFFIKEDSIVRNEKNSSVRIMLCFKNEIPKTVLSKIQEEITEMIKECDYLKKKKIRTHIISYRIITFDFKIESLNESFLEAIDNYEIQVMLYRIRNYIRVIVQNEIVFEIDYGDDGIGITYNYEIV